MPRSAARSALALLISFLALAGTLLVGATPAYAHASVVRSDPPDGAVLGGPPQQVRLWFSEPIALGLTTFDLVDGSGRHIAITGVHADAASLAVAVRTEQVGVAQVVIDLPSLPPSVYRLSWRTLSNTDLHNTTGMIVFGVQRDTAGAAATAFEALPSPLEVALRWLNFGAIAALLGALALALPALPQATRAPSVASIAPEQVAHMRLRLLALAEWSGTAALMIGLALLLAQALVVGGSLTAGLVIAWEIMSGTSYGLAWLTRQAALVLLAASVTFYRQRMSKLDAHSSGWLAVPMIVLALVIAFAQALQGHATAFAELSALRVAADALHILAAGIWVGGLLALAVAIVPLLRAGPERMALAWAILRRFGVLAAGSLAALLVTGLFMSGQQVASLDALLTTLYGRALLLKVGLVAAVALIGLRNAASLHPRVASALRWPATALTPALPRHPSPAAAGEGESRLPSPVATGEGLGVRATARLARTVRLEVIGAAAVLLLAAFLTAAQPARGPAFDPPVAETQAVAMTNADDLVVTLALKPNRPGQNFVTLGVFDTRRPARAPIDEVAVQFRLPGQAPLVSRSAAALGKGRYEFADDSITGAGDLAIVVTVRRSGLPDTVATIPWTVLPAAQQPRAVLVSNSPLAPWADRAALAITLVLAGLLFAWWLRRLIPRVPFIKSIKSGVAGRRLRPLRPLRKD